MPDFNLFLYKTTNIFFTLIMSFSWIILIIFILEFSKNDFVIQNSFYYFFAFFCGIDLIFTFVYFVTNEINNFFGLNVIFENFQDWHFFYVLFIWQLFIAINRATAICSPWQHSLCWKFPQIMVAFSLPLFYQLLFGLFLLIFNADLIKEIVYNFI